MKKRRFPLLLRIGLIAVIIILSVCLLLFICVYLLLRPRVLAEIDLGHGRKAIIAERRDLDTLHQCLGVFSRIVGKDEQESFGWYHIGNVADWEEPKGAVKKLLALKFSTVSTEDGGLVGIIESRNPNIIVDLIDFRSDERWCKIMCGAPPASAKKARHWERLRLKELKDAYPGRSFRSGSIVDDDGDSAKANTAKKIFNNSDRRWLEARLEKVVGQTRNKLPDGTTIYSAGGYGPHVWARDMYYIVSPARDLVPADEVKAVVELFLKHQRPDGSVPKGISARGRPSYAVWNVPGGFDSLELPLDRKSSVWSSQNAKAEGDSAQFVVLLAYEYFDRTADKKFVARNLPALVRAMDSMPRSRHGLIWIDPKNPHTSYGFTDNVAKTGEELFCSLLYWEASRRLAEMARAVDRPKIAADFIARAELIEKNIDRLKDEKTGLYYAAGELGRQIDVWGNAYLVYIGFPDADRRERISRYLVANRDAFVLHGQVRHLLKPEYWQKTFHWPTGGDYPKDRYQNGGYWGTASGWVIYAIAQTDRRAAARMLGDLVDYYRQNGVYEWINEEGVTERPDYAASVSNPLAALRRLQPLTTDH